MSEQVHTGQWTDHSYGSITGSRLTVSTRDAGYLIALLALFCGWVGKAAWKLIAFLLHQHQATPEARDGVFHQLQVALRNSTSYVGFVVVASRIGFAWRNRSTNAMSSVSRIAAIASILGALFTAGATLSSRIASNEGGVLLTGDACGYTTSSSGSELDKITLQLANNMQTGISLTSSNAYAQDCYSNPLNTETSSFSGQTAAGTSCHTFTKPSLNYTLSLGCPCPFEDACAVDDSQVVQLDTGNLDSHIDLGINQPLENRILFRRVTTCSPLRSDGFTDNHFHAVASLSYLGNVSTYSYGKNAYQPTRFGVTLPLPYANTTFVYAQDTYTASESAYYMMVASTMMNFVPVPEISRQPTQPMSLIFLANRAFYSTPVNDTWFNATAQIQRSASGIGTSYYASANLGSVLGCIEQLQVCNPIVHGSASSPRCTDLDTWHTWGGYMSYYTNTSNSVPSLTSIGLNPVQVTTALMLQEAALSASIFNIIDQLGPRSLLASSYLSQQEFFWSPGLNPNQWALEAANWFNIGLAQLQRFIITNYRKPSAPILQRFWVDFPANASAARAFCESQKVQNARFTTFDVLALALIVGVGVVTITAGYGAPFALPVLQKLFGARRYHERRAVAKRQWRADHYLHLQSRLFQACGLGGEWEGEEDYVPRTRREVVFEAPRITSQSARSPDELLNTEPWSPSEVSKTTSTAMFVEMQESPWQEEEELTSPERAAAIGGEVTLGMMNKEILMIGEYDKENGSGQQ